MTAIFLRVLTAMASASMALSPAPDMLRIHRNKSTGLSTVVPIVCYWACMHTWMWYGVLTQTYLICMTTSFGQLCATVFFAVFYYWSDDRARVHRTVLIAAAMVVPIVGYAALSMTGATGQSIASAGVVMGLIGDTFSILMSGSPLVQIKDVMQTKSAESLPAPLICMSLVNSTMWLIFGFLENDVYVMLPNLFGVPLGLFQVALCVVYRKPKMPAALELPTQCCPHSQLETGRASDETVRVSDLSLLETLPLTPSALESPACRKESSFDSDVADFAPLRSPAASASFMSVSA